MKKYSSSLKKEALELSNKLHSVKKAASLLGVGVPTIYKWKKLYGPIQSRDPVEELKQEILNLKKITNTLIHHFNVI